MSDLYDSSISTLKWCLTAWVSSKQRHLESYSVLILCICSQRINFYIYIAGCRHRHVTDLGWQAVGTLCILILFNPLLPLSETCLITNGITSHWALLIIPVNHSSTFPLERVQMVRASTAKFNASTAEMMCSQPSLQGHQDQAKKELQMFSASVSWLSWSLVGFSEKAEDFHVVWARIIVTIQFCKQQFVCCMVFCCIRNWASSHILLLLMSPAYRTA